MSVGRRDRSQPKEMKLRPADLLGLEETPGADAMRSVAGVTRGKRLVVLLGQKKAVAIAAKNVSAGGGGRSCVNG